MNYILYGEQYPMIKKRLKKILKENLNEPDDFNVVKIEAPKKDSYINMKVILSERGGSNSNY